MSLYTQNTVYDSCSKTNIPIIMWSTLKQNLLMNKSEYNTIRGTLNSSGAAYGGEPQNVFNAASILHWVLKPKSPTFTACGPEKNTFSALRSRWMMLLLCC